MIILVCGGRNYTNRESIHNTLKKYVTETPLIVSGGATGADTLAVKWARSNNIKYRVFPADWKQHGKRAGIIRNHQMLDECTPDIVIAFPGGKGTQHMVKISRDRNIDVVVVDT